MSIPQHQQARELANAVKRCRQQLRQEVEALDTDPGCALLGDIIDVGYHDRDEIRLALRRLHVVAALAWVHRMQPTTAARYAAAVGASEYRTIGELTDRQRGLLAELLRGGMDALRAAEADGGMAA